MYPKTMPIYYVCHHCSRVTVHILASLCAFLLTFIWIEVDIHALKFEHLNIKCP